MKIQSSYLISDINTKNINSDNNIGNKMFAGNNTISELVCGCSFGQAQVNMQNPKEFEIIKSIIKPPKQILKKIIYRSDGCTYIRIGEPMEHWNNLFDIVAYAACYYDENNKLKRIFIQEKKSLATGIYNAFGNLEKSYTPEEMNALKYYKYHPASVHKLLRYGRNLYSGSWAAETQDCIKKLDMIFKTKTLNSEQEMLLYRGLDRNFDELDIKDGIYTDKSFISTTTDVNAAKRFANGHPVMEIIFPEKSEYIDMDGLFNVDHKHWRENEYLLNRNGKFLIKGYDKETNLIRAEYIPQ